MLKEIKYNGFRYLHPRRRVARDKKRIGILTGLDNVFDFTELRNKHKNEVGYVIAPGPSFDAFNRPFFKGKVTFAVNSAGFVVDTAYWVIDEGAYAKYLSRVIKKIPKRHKKVFAVSVRAGIRLYQGQKKSRKKKLYNKLYILRMMEESLLPVNEKMRGRATLNAIKLAEFTGCKQIYILGLDFGVYKGYLYTKGIPEKDYPKDHKKQIPYFQSLTFSKRVINVSDVDHKLPIKRITVKKFIELFSI